MKPDLVAGSSLWQTIFVSFAVVLLLWQIARGWRLGLPRQLVRVAALFAAYSAALWGGQLTLPLLRPLLKIPDFFISMLGGAILAMIVYSVINTVGTIVFKRTGQQESGIVRLIYGLSGGFIGLLFGLFFICLLVVGIRSLGAIGEAEVNARARRDLPASAERPARGSHRTRAAAPDENSVTVSLARLKNSIELGPLGDLVKQADMLPGANAEMVGKMGAVVAHPERAAHFLSYPGVSDLADNPKILALRADPQIARMIEEGRLWDLLQDDRVIEVVNDPELTAQLKKIDLEAALDHAAKPQ